MQSDIAEIARGLSEPQRSLMRILEPIDPRPRRFMYSFADIGRRGRLDTCHALARRGIVARDGGCVEAFERVNPRIGFVTLTPLGLAVRDHLLSKDKTDV